MKKEYMKPELKAIEIQAEQFIATSGGFMPTSLTPGETLDSEEQFD